MPLALRLRHGPFISATTPISPHDPSHEERRTATASCQLPAVQGPGLTLFRSACLLWSLVGSDLSSKAWLSRRSLESCPAARSFFCFCQQRRLDFSVLPSPVSSSLCLRHVRKVGDAEREAFCLRRRLPCISWIMRPTAKLLASSSNSHSVINKNHGQARLGKSLARSDVVSPVSPARTQGPGIVGVASFSPGSRNAPTYLPLPRLPTPHNARRRLVAHDGNHVGPRRLEKER